MTEPTSDSKIHDSASKSPSLSSDLYLLVGIAIAMLLWALVPTNPYGYYMVLRWVVCGASIYLAVKAHSLAKPKCFWILVVLALLYNPFIRAHLSRDTWSVVNLATIVVFAVTFYVLRKRSK